MMSITGRKVLTVGVIFLVVVSFLLFFAMPVDAASRNLTDAEKELVEEAIKFLQKNGCDSLGGINAPTELNEMLGSDAPDGLKKIRREDTWGLGEGESNGRIITLGLPDEEDINTDIDTPEGFTQVKTVAQTLYHEWVHHRRFQQHGRNLIPALDQNWAACQPLWDEVEAYYLEIKQKLSWKLAREAELATIPGYGIAGPPTIEQQQRGEQLTREIADLESQIEETAGPNYLAGKRKVSPGSDLEKSYEEGGSLISSSFAEMDNNQSKSDEVTARLNDISLIYEGAAKITLEAKIAAKVQAYNLNKLLERIMGLINRFTGGSISLILADDHFIEVNFAPNCFYEGDLPEVEVEIYHINSEYMIPWQELGCTVLSPLYQVTAPLTEMTDPQNPATVSLSFDSEALQHNAPHIYQMRTEARGRSEAGTTKASWVKLDGEIVDLVAGTITAISDDPLSLFVVMEIPFNDISFAINPTGGGTAIDVTGTGPYEVGTVIAIKAEPNPDYSFSHWSAPFGAFDDANAAETTFTMPAQSVTITANFTTGITFPDVPSDHVHYAGIQAIAAEGITVGYADGTFRPSQPVTRAEMATFLFRALNLTDPGTRGTFPDVTAGSTHEASIEAIAAEGITTGYDDDTFRPSQPVTRAEMATFLFRALKLSDPGTRGTFPDVPADHVHEVSIEAIAAEGITIGYFDGTFRPSQAVTRAEMATFLARALGLIV